MSEENFKEQPSIRDIVIRWKFSYPKGYVAKRQDEYLLAYRELFQNLKKYGYTKDDIGVADKRFIIENTMIKRTTEKFTAKRKAEWKENCELFYDAAFIEAFDIVKLDARTEEETNKFVLERPEIPKEEEKPLEIQGTELTKDMLDKMPTANVIIDPEMAELLGYKDDE